MSISEKQNIEELTQNETFVLSLILSHQTVFILIIKCHSQT